MRLLNLKLVVLFAAFWRFAFVSSVYAEAYIYLTKEEALKAICGSFEGVKYDPKPLSDEILERLEKAGLEPLDKKTAHFFICPHGSAQGAAGSGARYALIDSEIGKHRPITYIVGISADGKVTGVEVMVYREEYGSQVKHPSFLHQYKGKTKDDSLRIGRDIKYVTGATISSRSMSKGVKRALILWDEFYKNGGNQGKQD